MYTRSCVFLRISTVLLIHEIVLSGCDLLNTKSPYHLVRPHVNGYQRKARQAPIDPSRMYLPPKIDAVASSGFGGQVDASNNFGDNINGYGEIGLDQNTYGRSSSGEGSNYESSTKATNDLNEGQTSAGPYGTTSTFEGSSLDLSTAGYNNVVTGGNNFDQSINKNGKYNDPSLHAVTGSYGDSSGTKSTSTSNDINAQTDSANSYGRSEILNTAQSQGISQINYNKLAEGSTFRQNTGVREQYATSQDSSRNSGQDPYDQRNNEKFGSNGNQQLSGNHRDYKNVAPSSLNQKSTSGAAYNPISNGDNAAGYSYDQPSVSFDDFSTQNFNNQNNPIKNTLQINNENYSQYGAPNMQRFQVGEHNRGTTSTLNYEQPSARLNQGKLSSPQLYEQNTNGKLTNTDTYSTNTKDLNSPFSGTSYDSYGQSSQENDRFNQKSSSNYESGFNLNPQSSSQKLNEYGQPGTNVIQNRENYGQNVRASNDYNNRGSSNDSGSSQSYRTNDVDGRNSVTQGSSINDQHLGVNRDISATPLPEKYRYTQTREKNNLPTIISGQNSGQRGSDSSSNYRRGRIGSCALLCSKIIGRNGLSSSASIGSSKSLDNGDRSHKKIHSTLVREDQYQNSNLPSRGYLKNSGKDDGNYGKPGANAFSNFAPGSLPNQPPINNDQPGANAFSNFAPDSLPNQPPVNNDQPGANAFSNFAPDSLPNQPPVNNDQPGANAFSNFAPGSFSNQSPNNNDQPGANSFSNFAPDSLPNQPSVNDDQPGANAFSNFAPGSLSNQPSVNNDQPSANAFSNFAPGSLPNQPPVNNDQPSANAFSNFAPGSLPNQPPVNDDQPGANAFSNFAPYNFPNLLPTNNDQPGANAFSNFAPGNQPNQPPPANPTSSNNCGKISAHINNANKQTEVVFSNIGY